jgi:PAS domain S-box-containing protein
MTPAAPTSNERERLAALERYQILDSPPEKEFDDLTSLAAHICGTPIALISLVDAHRQWFKSKVGVEAEVTETPRDISFCGHCIQLPHLMEVPDARKDFLFYDNPLVAGESEICFYAGMPLSTPDGQNLGTLCVMDHVPRQLTPFQRETLARLGRQVMNQMELRLTTQRLADADKNLHEMEERARLILEASPNAMVMVNDKERVALLNSKAEQLFGYSREELLDQPIETLVPIRYQRAKPGDKIGFFSAAKPQAKGENSDVSGRRKDGTDFPVEIALNPLTTAAGAFVLVSIVDLTPRKRMENRINRLKRDLKRQARKLDAAGRDLIDFASLVSRDLQAPLRRIGSLANRLATDSRKAHTQVSCEQLNLLAIKVRRLNSLIDRIAASPNTGQARNDRTNIPFQSVPKNTVKLFPLPRHSAVGNQAIESDEVRKLVHAC